MSKGRVGKEREKGGPNVPGKVFAPGEDHATVAVASALERLCGGGAVALVDALKRLLLLLLLLLRVLLLLLVVVEGEEEGLGVDEGGHLLRRGVHRTGAFAPNAPRYKANPCLVPPATADFQSTGQGTRTRPPPGPSHVLPAFVGSSTRLNSRSSPCVAVSLRCPGPWPWPRPVLVPLARSHTPNTDRHPNITITPATPTRPITQHPHDHPSPVPRLPPPSPPTPKRATSASRTFPSEHFSLRSRHTRPTSLPPPHTANPSFHVPVRPRSRPRHTHTHRKHTSLDRKMKHPS